MHTVVWPTSRRSQYNSKLRQRSKSTMGYMANTPRASFGILSKMQKSEKKQRRGPIAMQSQHIQSFRDRENDNETIEERETTKKIRVKIIKKRVSFCARRAFIRLRVPVENVCKLAGLAGGDNMLMSVRENVIVLPCVNKSNVKLHHAPAN